MKILLVNDYGTPTGGAELQILNLREELRARGHDARLFASSAGEGKSAADYQCFGTTSSFRTILQSANPFARKALRKVLQDFEPDLVHVTIFLTQLSPLILSLFKNIPALYYSVWYRMICPVGTKMLPDGSACSVPAGSVCYHNHCLPLRDWIPLQLQARMVAKWRGVFNAIAANSEAVRDALVSAGFGDIEVIWPGVPEREARSQSQLASTPVVAFAGRLVKEKGAEILLRAFAQIRMKVPAAKLWILGDGPERAHLENLAAALLSAGSVQFTGYLPRTEMERRLEQAWVQVVPSVWPEPFGMAATEAMMRGVPVIGSDAGGLKEIVTPGISGFLVPRANHEALADSLLTLLTNRERCVRMGEDAHKIAIEKFGQRASADRFIALYQRIIKDGQQAVI